MVSELKPLETGEICVIGPAVFAGYHDNPEANAKAFRDGWFRTGDLGHMDAEGFVYITGRASDMYISGGSNIYPREVEEKSSPIPRSAKSRSRRARSGRGRGRFAVAWRARGQSVTERTWRDSSPESAALQDAEAIFLREALPKSGYGKIPKRLVRDEFEARGLHDLSAKPAR